VNITYEESNGTISIKDNGCCNIGYSKNKEQSNSVNELNDKI
jgi:hypothetical protein